MAVDAFALDELKTFLRIDGESEDSALSALIATAVEQCEAFVGVAVLQRAMAETLAPTAAWQLLTPTPVRVISGVASLSRTRVTTAGRSAICGRDVQRTEEVKRHRGEAPDPG